MDNPFKPKEVKLFNYRPISNDKKIENIHNNMHNVANTHYKKEENSYSNNLRRPDTYSDHLKRPSSYGDAHVKDNQNR